MEILKTFISKVFAELDFKEFFGTWEPDKLRVKVSTFSKKGLHYIFLFLERSHADLTKEFIEIQQADLHQWCLREFGKNASSFSKNLYLILVSPKSLTNSFGKGKVLEIEEDPYFFKKYFLDYDEATAEASLKDINKQKSAIEELRRRALNKESFLQFASGQRESKDISFIYHLLMKIPVIPLGTQTQDFENLETNIEQEMAKKNLNSEYGKLKEFASKQKDIRNIEDAALEELIKNL